MRYNNDNLSTTTLVLLLICHIDLLYTNLESQLQKYKKSSFDRDGKNISNGIRLPQQARYDLRSTGCGIAIMQYALQHPEPRTAIAVWDVEQLIELIKEHP